MAGRFMALLGVSWRVASRNRWWAGILYFLVLLAVLDRLGHEWQPERQWNGLILLVAVLLLGCWSGFRAALGSCVLIGGYVWLMYRFPSVFPGSNKKIPELTAIVLMGGLYAIFGVVGGTVHHVLARTRGRLEAAEAHVERETKIRRDTQAELWASVEMQSVILDSAVDAVIGISTDRTVMLWSPNAEKLLGWTRTESLGLPASSVLVAPLPTREGEVDIMTALETDASSFLGKQIETAVRSKSGELVDVELTVIGHESDAGTMHLVFAHDIRDRKRSEQVIRDLNASLRDLNARLEDRVAERTRQLEAANEELLGFTYSVSHDLRAPLRAIVSNSRIACMDSKDVLPAESLGRLQRVEASALKMAELIDNLLQYARIGRVSLSPEEVDLSAMAVRIGNDLKLAQDGSLLVEPGVTVRGDPELVELVLVNLLENAWKYVGIDQHPVVSVGKTPDGAIFVRDQGIGFDMQYAGKIWQPFERLHNEKDYPGTGIGLANAKRIIERHGGQIWTESTPGQGTTMYFRLGPTVDGPKLPSLHKPQASAR